MPPIFLTARWCNLFLANFPVPAALLQPRLPPGLELDLWDGQPYISVVAFQFRDTRVLGVPWPGYRNFPEINLRFYVRRGTERGVVFIRELVPHRLTAWVARMIYNEPYRVAPIAVTVREKAEDIAVEYTLEWGGRQHYLSVTGSRPAFVPPEGSVEHHFKELYWGYGTTRGGHLIRYGVEHPVWEVYPVLIYCLQLDWAAVYGPEWGFLSKATPSSVVFAAGSAIKVLRGEIL